MADLYADRNIRSLVWRQLRGLGHAVTPADEIHPDRTTDDVHLLTAAERGSILLTYNHKDFVLLHDAWHLWSRAWGVSPIHAGIIVPRSEWLAARASAEIDRLLSSIDSFENALYEWHGEFGWIRRT